ncbi:hypothetical protein MUK42_18080 [Musa troglodytarum]|uniref:Uncharacterized protein n=1 Tax=Musa troglodytarum TaxID=320322 RepID=A0A9E7GTX9_9LILI|nr:hypothetical protein MUK42_18080 [Musa troglodytarum]
MGVRIPRRWDVDCIVRTKRVGCNVDRPSDDDPAVVIRSRCITGVDIENGNKTWGKSLHDGKLGSWMLHESRTSGVGGLYLDGASLLASLSLRLRCRFNPSPFDLSLSLSLLVLDSSLWCAIRQEDAIVVLRPMAMSSQVGVGGFRKVIRANGDSVLNPHH